MPGADAHAALRYMRWQLQRSCLPQRHLQLGTCPASQHRCVWPRCRSSRIRSHTFAPDVLLAVTGSFVHAHAVVVDAVRFAAFIAVSPVLPGTGIQNTQSGIMQLRECQCTSSLRFGCFIVGSAIIDCRHISNSHLQHCAVMLLQYALLTSSTAGGVCGAIVPKVGGHCTAPPRSTPASLQKVTGTVATRFLELKSSYSRPVRCSSDNTTNC